MSVSSRRFSVCAVSSLPPTRALPPCFWQLMISLKAYSYDNKFLIILHPPWSWRIICLCIKLACLSPHTADTVNQGHLAESKFYLLSPPANTDTHGTVTKAEARQRACMQWTQKIKLTKGHTCTCKRTCTPHTDAVINKVYTPRSRNVTGIYMR